MDQRQDRLAAFGQGRLYDAWTMLGAHLTASGTEFCVWAPNARSVAVTGDFCAWDGAGRPLRREDGAKEIFTPYRKGMFSEKDYAERFLQELLKTVR